MRCSLFLSFLLLTLPIQMSPSLHEMNSQATFVTIFMFMWFFLGTYFKRSSLQRRALINLAFLLFCYSAIPQFEHFKHFQSFPMADHDKPQQIKTVSLPVCQSASLPVCQSASLPVSQSLRLSACHYLVLLAQLQLTTSESPTSAFRLKFSVMFTFTRGRKC